jgi:hypothetical protein
MAMTSALILLLALAARRFGPLVGGMLAALPVLASLLAVFTHREDGPEAVVELLRGMLAGMAGFVSFCAVIALLVVPIGIVAAFAIALLAAVGMQMLSLGQGPRFCRRVGSRAGSMA